MTPGRTFFFLHIMKTAGTSFAQHLRANFGPEELYPIPSLSHEVRERQYWEIAALRELRPEQVHQIRMFHGHFPVLAAAMVGADTTMTIVRDPVDRVISHVRHCRRHFPAHHGTSLESVYEDGWLHPLFFRNYQVKQFALTADDAPMAHNEDIVIDSGRVAAAVASLEKVDVLGLTEHYDQFLDEVVDRFGWARVGNDRLQASPGPMKVSAAFRKRIEADNQADLEFHDRATSLYWERRAGRSRPAAPGTSNIVT